MNQGMNSNKLNPRSLFDPDSAFVKYDSDGLSVYSGQEDSGGANKYNDTVPDWHFMKK